MRFAATPLLLLAVAGASSAGLALSVTALTATVGCGSSSPSAKPCNEDPWQCGSGQTCWPQQCTCPSGTSCDPSNCTPQFSCVTSSVGKRAGDSCMLQIGQSTCGDLQTCVELADAGSSGACRYYCDPADPSHGCATGFECVPLTVGNSQQTENVCVPTPLGDDASLNVDAPQTGDDGGGYDPDALPPPGDAPAETIHFM